MTDRQVVAAAASEVNSFSYDDCVGRRLQTFGSHKKHFLKEALALHRQDSGTV